MERTKRPHTVSTWLSREEYGAVTAAARATGLSLAALLRRATVARARGVLRRAAAPRCTAIADRVVREVLLSKEA